MLEPWRVYGSDADRIDALEKEEEGAAELLHPSLPYRKSQVVWAVREEMAVRIEDVLSRRLRALVLNAGGAVESAPEVARIMAKELGRDEAWMRDEIASFQALAEGYLPG